MEQNYLLDKDFLRALDEYPHKEKFAKIIALTFDENQVEEIQGKITSGSINVDGTSAVRRTCNLTMVATDVKIDEFLWSLNTKFKLFIGLRNEINNNYPEIIWLPMGLYLISSFNQSLNSNSYTISISGKDKMCLLNGDVGGTVNSLSWDFGTEDFTDTATGIIINKHRLIKDIVRDAVQEYAKEPYGRIQVNDLDEAAIELMEYRGSKPLYMFIDMTSNTCTQVTLDDQLEMYAIDIETPIKISDENLVYNNCVDLELNNVIHNEPNILYMENPLIKPVLSDENPDGQHPYTIAKIVYGQTAGYRQTDLTYAGDLILSTGESITSMLDKIVQMLGEYEYFYDLDGNFVFQRKKTFINVSFNNIVDNRDETYVENASQTSAVQYNFRDNNLISSIQHTPNIGNLKNDYSIWGKKIGATGQELPIHIRYAIDKKPTYYKAFNGNKYVSSEPDITTKDKTIICDWREIIYQMALDYRRYYYNNIDNEFFVQLQENNGIDNEGNLRYPGGKTGYEQYYTDMEGFWRQIYCAPTDYRPITLSYKAFKEAEAGNYYIREFNEDTKSYDYIDIKANNKLEYNSLTTYYTPGWENYWAPEVTNAPESLNFWIDFLDNDSDMAKYSVYAIGDRTKTLNDDKIKAIYFRETPTVIFFDPKKETAIDRKTGYVYIQCPTYMEQLFQMSAQGKSAIDQLNISLYNYGYAVESVSLNTIPVYYLQPNARILVYDNKTGINGEYIVTRLSYQLSHNGLMSITATKAPERLY